MAFWQVVRKAEAVILSEPQEEQDRLVACIVGLVLGADAVRTASPAVARAVGKVLFRGAARMVTGRKTFDVILADVEKGAPTIGGRIVAAIKEAERRQMGLGHGPREQIPGVERRPLPQQRQQRQLGPRR